MSGGRIILVPPRRLALPAARERHRRQHRPLRRDGRRGVPLGHRGRAVRRPQLRRHGRRRGPGRPRLRVHDRRHRRRPRRHRVQLRRRHERRHRLRLRRHRTLRHPLQPRHGRPGERLDRRGQADPARPHHAAPRLHGQPRGPPPSSTTGRPTCRCSSRSCPSSTARSSSACGSASSETPRPCRPRRRCSMGKPTGFMEYARQDPKKRPVAERIADYREVEQPLSAEELALQACRCMDCGIPYCHAFGCPLANRIPEFNDMVYREAVAAGPGPAARDEQLPGGHRPHLPRPVRGRLHPLHQPGGRHDPADRTGDRGARLARGMDPAGAGRAKSPAAASPSSAPGRRAWPPPSNSPARGTRSSSSRRPPRPAASCGTASPTSNSKRPSSTGGWSS